MIVDVWMLDESKFLTLREVCRLRKATFAAKERAVSIRTVTPVRDWFLSELCLATGVRVMEAADITCGDLLLWARPYRVRIRNGKGHKPRLIQITEIFRNICSEFMKWKKAIGEPTCEDSPLFYSCKTHSHMSRRALQKAYKRCLKRAGIPQDKYGIHSLRHTYGTHLYEASGSDIRFVQKQLGHSSVRTTQIYADVRREKANLALVNLDRLYMCENN